MSFSTEGPDAYFATASQPDYKMNELNIEISYDTDNLCIRMQFFNRMNVSTYISSYVYI